MMKKEALNKKLFMRGFFFLEYSILYT